MKITIIVGNGFDIGLGLKTSYSDFISEYADLSRPYDPYAIETKLKKLINRNKLSWADAEVAFARLSFDSILNDCEEFDRSFLNMDLSWLFLLLFKFLIFCSTSKSLARPESHIVLGMESLQGKWFSASVPDLPPPDSW